MAANSILRLALRRSLAGKRLLAVVALGVFVAATLLASAPIYARAMADLGLTFTVREELQSAPNTMVTLPDVQLQTPSGRAIQTSLEDRITQRIGWFRSSEARYTRLGRFGIAKPGNTATTGLVQAQPQSLPGYEQHVTVLSGQLPQPTVPGEPMQLALSSQAASVAAVKSGDVIELRENFDTCARVLPQSDPPPPPPPCDPTATVAFTIPAVVSAIIQPIDSKDPFWTNTGTQYFDPFRLEIDDVGPIIPVFANDQTIFNSFGATYPEYHAFVQWHVFADPSKLNRDNFAIASSDIGSLGDDARLIGGYAVSPLRDTLTRYARSENYQSIPLTVLLLEITGIALFYVGLVSAIVVERQAADIALLRSRGASISQIGSIYLWQGLVIGIPAVLLAPFLAAAVTALLGATPIFHDVTGGSLLPVTIPPIAFGAAAIGVGLSLLALLVPALIVARRSTTGQRRLESRPRPSILHRYYLDLVLAAAAVLALFELNQRGSVFEPSSTGGLSSDPLLLASPALVIAAAAAIVLRIYPMLVRLAARLVNAGAGLSVSLGLMQVVRNSAQYTRLTLLLMMAVAVGSFAASYSTTTDQSYKDRAAYETGADLHAMSQGQTALPLPAADNDAKLRAVPGVANATGVIRTKAGLATPGIVSQDTQLLGVDQSALRGMLWWRNDFATKPLDTLLDSLASPAVLPGTPLPGNSGTLSIWVKGDKSLADVTFWARVRDAEDRISIVELGKLDTGGEWKKFSADVHSNFESLTAPLTLVSLNFTEIPNRFNTNYTPLLLDDLTLTDPAGKTTVIESFESGLRWSTFVARTPHQDAIEITHDGAHSGVGAAKITFRTEGSSDIRGIHSTPQPLPLAALASESFLRSTGLHLGSSTTLVVGKTTLVPITIAGVYNLFPTLPSEDGPSLVVNRDQLMTWAETASFAIGSDIVPTEAFLSLKPGADSAAVVKAISTKEFGIASVDSKAAQLDSNRRNPLIAAGGSGILFVSFVAMLVLVSAALLVSLLTSVGRRRVEFAVVRSMGVSRGQIFRMLALEYAIVAVAGTAVGAALGLVVGRQMLSFLDVTEQGTKIEPGFVLHTEWGVVAIAVGVVLVVFATALVLATRVVARIADSQALRTE